MDLLSANPALYYPNPLQSMSAKQKPKLSSLEKCEIGLRKKLEYLKSVGILDDSLTPEVRSIRVHQSYMIYQDCC